MAEASPAGNRSGARKNATIYDIAHAADVSHQSVSRYMRGLDMRATTKVKIEKALELLDYKPNLTARALITGRSLRIGALTHETHQVGPNMVIQGATAAAREAGYLLDVVTLDMGDAAEIGQALASLMQYDLAGILAFASTDGTRDVFERTRFDVPVVIASETDEPDSVDASRTATHGIDDLVSHLADLGHRTFLHIAGPEDWAAARNRRHAFESAMSSRGFTAAGIVHGDWSAKSGYDAISAMPAADVPTAIVAANDQMALGAMHALHEHGLAVPRDVSVTGLDDTPEAAYFTPSLTTIRLDFRAQGREALAELLRQVDPARPESESEIPRIDSALLIRESTGPAARQ
ncbi:substrate-binding domain-containing protein [Microbacterium terricola]|uniref:LacI family transcriptional regulator n=1 Tax=Microbacterium terricola TaxID=344163 RepID=A0ABM8E3H5_9MICO|nr:substrate-binding domain-containing protein [Microbacterium terricola]UYK40010.1 substrate-binding domain-containing protein [Microbacterium terricola]BDV32300.1 LacI family transcriptional regulator [Microbacterium terricola]